MSTERHDFLFFVHIDGGGENYDDTGGAFVVQDLPVHDIPIVIEEMGDTTYFQHGDQGAGDGNYTVQGVIQLAREQTHYKDTAIIKPTRFIVFFNGSSMFLHDVPQFKRPASAAEMEATAERDLETKLDEERAEGEGMYVDEPSDDIPPDPYEEAVEASGGDADHG